MTLLMIYHICDKFNIIKKNMSAIQLFITVSLTYNEFLHLSSGFFSLNAYKQFPYHQEMN